MHHSRNRPKNPAGSFNGALCATVHSPVVLPAIEGSDGDPRGLRIPDDCTAIGAVAVVSAIASVEPDADLERVRPLNNQLLENLIWHICSPPHIAFLDIKNPRV